MTNKKVLEEICAYPMPNWIWLEIWEIDPYKIELIITVNEEEMVHLGQHKVIHVCSARTDEIIQIRELKARGRQLAHLIRRSFQNSQVHSRLYYK